jgi:UDP-N-acetylenolpyruvoylglucosamine reductase
MNAGDVGSHVSSCFKSISNSPLGKLEASGSCCTNCAQISLQHHYRHMMFQRKHRVFSSCSSQWLKPVCNVTPLDKAHSFIPIAI